MGMKSRTKGKVGEAEIARIISDLTGWTVRRRVRQLDGEADLEGIPNFTPEVKRHATATRAEIKGWWEQAVTQACIERKLPVLFYRKDRDEWRAVWAWNSESGIIGVGYDMTLEGSIDAWAAVARDIESSKEIA